MPQSNVELSMETIAEYCKAMGMDENELTMALLHPLAQTDPLRAHLVLFFQRGTFHVQPATKWNQSIVWNEVACSSH